MLTLKDDPRTKRLHSIIKEAAEHKCVSGYGRNLFLYFNTLHDEVIQSILFSGPAKSKRGFTWLRWYNAIYLDEMGVSVWADNCLIPEHNELSDMLHEARALHIELMAEATKIAKMEEQVEKKGTDQAIRDVYEKKTGQSAAPGTGPADLIRKFVGVQPRKGTGRRKTRRRKTRK